MNTTLDLALDTQLQSPYQRAVDLCESSGKIRVTVELNETKIVVPAALVGARTLGEIFRGEKYAATIGGMFFVTKTTPEHYRPFAVFHELAEHAAPRGFDVTGRAAHFQAIVLELAYAQRVLAHCELETYVAWRKSVERTNFFSLGDDGLIGRIAERMAEHFEVLQTYLTYRGRLLVDVAKVESAAPAGPTPPAKGAALTGSVEALGQD